MQSDCHTPILTNGLDHNASLTIQMPGFVQGAQKLWNLAALFSLVAVIPPVVLFMVLRRYMVRGLSLGVVKG